MVAVDGFSRFFAGLRRAGRPSGSRSLFGIRGVAGRVFALMLGLVVLVVAAAAVSLVLQGRRDSGESAESRSLAIAQAFAYSPGLVAALEGPDPTAALQPPAEATRKETGVEYVVVSDKNGFRYTHPDPALIGKHILGPYKEAAAGHPFTRTFTGSRGPAVNSVVPVLRDDGSVAGLVSVGITVETVNRLADRDVPVFLGAAAAALLCAAGGAALVSRRLSRQTHGLGPVEMTRMYEHHDAVLHSVREGVLIVGADGRLMLVNDEARRLLGLAAGTEGRPVTELGLPADVTALIASGRTVTDEVWRAGNRVLAVNLRPTGAADGASGTVVTLRDTTELRAVTDRAEEVGERLLLLYEAGARIGTTLDVRRTAEELTEVATPRFADAATVDLAEPVLRGDQPPSSGRTAADMRRTAVSAPGPDPPFYEVGRLVGVLPAASEYLSGARRHTLPIADSTVLGRHKVEPGQVERIERNGYRSLLTVPLHARGVVLGMVNFWRRDGSEPFDDDDVSFGEELAARAAVCIDNARRYTREHETAVTLQRSLLPRGLPEQSALDVAYRYLPATAGVGGDWFDVIPLPGARVALVVGDVVGHGLHAAATMGRLRTAVQNFAMMDLPADELLARVDELVVQVDSHDPDSVGDAGITGATCLYAIYDPVGGSFSLAKAGHPGPALVLPDGTAAFPDVPAGLPLGIGGMPYEAVDLPVPEGSRLVLFTDGLVETRERDIGAGLEQLRAVLGGGVRTPDRTCAALLDAMLTSSPADDVAVLVAGTRVFAPERVAVWDVEPEDSAVAVVRKGVARQLSAWGFDEEAFTTELILSELVTNAIRYGRPPIRVRLLYERSLICEVSDGSSTAPHLRYAATTDEGGRGLFLVAQFSSRWGTRYTDRGKVIWSEQTPDAM
ncbi:SpoIIE family protein phosphatase [Streptomyces sp. NPDC055749]